MIKFLDLNHQYQTIKNEINEAIFSVVNDSSFIGGPKLKQFESDFAEYCDTKFCVGVGNGTDALEIAIEALNLPPGSEIIVPSNSFIASSEAVTRTGHKVVFCDVDSATLVINRSCVEGFITERTKAIIAVHLYGHPADMQGLLDLAEEKSLFVIEDCAQAHGAIYKGKVIGGIGHVAAFSFYPGKNLGAFGDAGAIVSNHKELIHRVRMIANHGRVGKYDHKFEGRNSRLDTLQASILSVKLKYLNDWTDRRIQIAEKYRQEFSDIPNITLCEKSVDVKHVYHLYVIRIEDRDNLKDYLNANGISTGVHYPVALPKLGAYSYLRKEQDLSLLNISLSVDSKLLSLPVGEHLSDAEVSYICKTVSDYYSNC